ncbi:hypothetical protein NHQ30_009177 [Ciborinia camelliae]|nr:hypothetical protein NHQ30_009177 [Ciborinia camelliae]
MSTKAISPTTPAKVDPHPNDPRGADCSKLYEEDPINVNIKKKSKAVGIPAAVELTSPDSPTDEQYQTCWILKIDPSIGKRDTDGDQVWDQRYKKCDFRDFTDAGPLAFNFESHKITFTNNKRTVEFRHHHGTLDPDAMFNWIHVCIKLVKKACLAKDDELFAQLRQDVSRPIGFGHRELSTVDFLMWLGCPAQAYYYGIIMTTDKSAFRERIMNDEKRREMHLLEARTYLESRENSNVEGFRRRRSAIEGDGSNESSSSFF